MKKKIYTILGIIAGIIVIALLAHLTMNWLVPMVVNMHRNIAY